MGLAACGEGGSTTAPAQPIRRAWTIQDGVARTETAHADRGTVDRLSIRCLWSIPDQRSTVEYELAATPTAGQKRMLEGMVGRDFGPDTRVIVGGAKPAELRPKHVRIGLQRLHLSETPLPDRRAIAMILTDAWPQGALSGPDSALLGALAAGSDVRVEIDLGHGQALTTAFTGEGAAQALTTAGCVPPPR